MIGKLGTKDESVGDGQTCSSSWMYAHSNGFYYTHVTQFHVGNCTSDVHIPTVIHPVLGNIEVHVAEVHVHISIIQRPK